MIVGLHTGTPTCTVYVGDASYSWEAGRDLAHRLPGFLEECLIRRSATFADVTGLVVFKGPGSFTGLRIGITVINTIAAAQGIAVVGTSGDGWYEKGTSRLSNAENDRIVLPEYGSEPHITHSKK